MFKKPLISFLEKEIKGLISFLEKEQVNTGSTTCPGFQVISLVMVVADRLSLDMTLGRTLVSPYSFTPSESQDLIDCKCAVL